MPSRRFHAKRRHGCAQCKARRVKCDAGAPCRHCSRRREPCSNASTAPDEASAALSLPSAIISSLKSPLDLNYLSSTETGAVLLGISNLELRLLNHYCTYVAPSISVHEHLRRMWQYEITQQAKTHSFLMHNILSSSAFHLSCAYAGPLQGQPERSRDVLTVYGISTTDASNRWFSRSQSEWQTQQSKYYQCFALEQQRLALQTYIPSLEAMTFQNQEALCAATALMSLSALASTQNRFSTPALRLQQSSPIDDWLEISILVRGVDAVVKSADDSILDGVLHPLLCHRRVESSGIDIENDVESQVKQLVSSRVLSALNALLPAIDCRISSEIDRIVYHMALELLRVSFAIVAINPDHESIVMVWSNLLDKRFFPFVERREPMALVLLAYWTVLFGTFRGRWWVGGLNLVILRHITELLIPLDATTEQGSDGRKDGEGVQPHLPFVQCLDVASESTTSKQKWRDLLEWPLRENGINNLYPSSENPTP